MRSISVDTQGLSFVVRIMVLVGCFGALLFAWGPGSTFFTHDAFNRSAASAALLLEKDTPREPITDTGEYVFVDTERMVVELHSGKTVIDTYPIVRIPDQKASTGMENGSFTVDEKKDAEVSTITLMRFPWYVRFGDRFALHGTPQKAQSAETVSEYVGGSVELSLEDSKKVYFFVETGTPVYVYVRNTEADSIDVVDLSDIESKELPATSAYAYAVADMETKQVYIVKNGEARYPIASITKLITAAVATDVIGHGVEIEAPDSEYYTLSDLYYPLLLRSDNAVAKSIAEHAGATFFFSNMNAYVRALGMTKTSFADASGLSPKNISTVNDLVKFAHFLYSQKPYLLDITNEDTMTITSSSGKKWSMTNQNLLASDPYFYGGKLGFTDEAGQTSLAIFNVPLANEVHPVAVIILHSKDWKQDTRTLTRWLVENTAH